MSKRSQTGKCITLAVLLTSFNRKVKTLSSLAAVFNNHLPFECELTIVLVDDASQDGTVQSVRNLYPEVIIINGDGRLFWNGGMRVAFDAALARGYDYYLWLNDDTLLYPTALHNLIEVNIRLSDQQRNGVIVVGATQDESTGHISYGGVTRPSKWKPTAFRLVPASAVPVECETMNGNCVLIPAQIANAIGGMEPGFAHAMGDLDYGLRARAAGFSIWVAPGFVGSCSNNSLAGSFNDTSLPVSIRLRKMLGPKGVPLESWRIFTKRHAGFFWPIYWLWPYAKVVAKGLVKR